MENVSKVCDEYREFKSKKKNIVAYLHKILNNNVLQFFKESNKYIIDKLHFNFFSIFMSYYWNLFQMWGMNILFVISNIKNVSVYLHKILSNH